jgi:hypothetical protein
VESKLHLTIQSCDALTRFSKEKWRARPEKAWKLSGDPRPKSGLRKPNFKAWKALNRPLKEGTCCNEKRRLRYVKIKVDYNITRNVTVPPPYN